MSELEQKAWDKGYACGKLDAAAHIEALEAELKLTKEYLNEGGRIILANVDRIEQLEAALRGIIQTLESLNDTKRASFYRGSVVNELTVSLDLARAALEQEK